MDRLIEDTERERVALADTLERVGPGAPTLCTRWAAADIGAHVASLDRLVGVPTFVGRWFVSRLALRLNAPASRFPQLADATLRGPRRRGYEWAIAQLRKPMPTLLRRPSVATVGLFEVWVHHQDVLRANDLVSPTDPDLSPVLPWLLRYQRVAPDAVIDAPLPEVVLWLAGRGSALRI